MKSTLDIQVELVECKIKLAKLKQEYDGLNQIDMLSNTGQAISTKIKHLEGKIEAFNWILKD